MEQGRGEQHLDDARSHGDDESNIRTVSQTKGLAGGKRLKSTCVVLLCWCALALLHSHAWRSWQPFTAYTMHTMLYSSHISAFRAACALICSTHRSSGRPWGRRGDCGGIHRPQHVNMSP